VGRHGGPRGPPRRGPCPVCALKQDAFGFVFFAGFKRDFPICLRGPSGLSPTVGFKGCELQESRTLKVRKKSSRRYIGFPHSDCP
jgi:hypothetical protein